jgi:hypothetical protein
MPYGIHTFSVDATRGGVIHRTSPWIWWRAMDDFAGAYGDKRRSAAMSRLYGSIVEQSSVVIRKVGVDRGGELAAHQVLSLRR